MPETTIATTGKVASINPAELWGAAGTASLAGLVVATGLPTRLGLTPEETAAWLLLLGTLAAIVRATFQAWSSGKRGAELVATAQTAASIAITPEAAEATAKVLRPLVERILAESRDPAVAKLLQARTRELPGTEAPRPPKPPG